MSKLSWKNVFNSRNVFPEPFYRCQSIASSVGYDYMSFNGFIYPVKATENIGTDDFICKEEDLI